MKGAVAVVSMLLCSIAAEASAETLAPKWIRKPSGEFLNKVYPSTAAFLGVSGAVTIGCQVTPVGSMKDCEVVREEPKDWGFGAAALKLAPEFHVQPRIVDGKLQAATVRIPLLFLPPQRVVPAAGAGASPAPDPARVALAKRLLEVWGGDNRKVGYLGFILGPFGGPRPKGDDDPAWKGAFDSVAKEAQESWPQFSQKQAELLATIHSEETLKSVVGFYESEAGQAWMNDFSFWDELHRAELEAVREEVITKVRKVECAKRGCPTLATPSPGEAEKIQATDQDR